jgi:transcription elongation factor GreA-like protein
MEIDMTPEELIKEIQGIFETEKWNKFQLSEYNLSKFQKLEELSRSVIELGIVDQVRAECEDVLHKNEYNFSALFILGMLNFHADKILDATAQFQKLVNNFKKKEKPSIVEYLCRKMLEYGDDIFALKNLIPVVRAAMKQHDLEELQERLVALDSSDSETLMQLASAKEKNDKKKEALNYYLTALNNFIRNKSRKSVEEVWTKIILLDPDYMDHLLPLEEPLQTIFEKDFVLHLLQALANPLFGSAKWDQLIALSKKIIAYKPDDKEAR